MRISIDRTHGRIAANSRALARASSIEACAETREWAEPGVFGPQTRYEADIGRYLSIGESIDRMRGASVDLAGLPVEPERIQRFQRPSRHVHGSGITQDSGIGP